MRQYLAGFVTGAFLASATAAYAAKLIGDGWLMGWDVTYEGEVICSSPYIWNGVQEIECD